jgi:hypothetical protein
MCTSSSSSSELRSHAAGPRQTALFGEADPELLALMRHLRSCRVAALCGMQPGSAPAVDEAAAWHLDR